MSWLKDVIVDIIATTLVIITVITSNSILSGILWGYTGLLLFIKLLVLIGNDFRNIINKAKNKAPEWFPHLLYATNTGVLLFFEFWYMGACWAAIWILSYLAQRRLTQQTA